MPKEAQQTNNYPPPQKQAIETIATNDEQRLFENDKEQFIVSNCKQIAVNELIKPTYSFLVWFGFMVYQPLLVI